MWWLSRLKKKLRESLQDFSSLFFLDKSTLCFYTTENGDLEAAKQYSLEQTNKDHLYYGANEAFLAMLAYIAYKEGDEQKAKNYFEKQNSMKNSMTKTYIENYDFPSVRSRVFVNDYVKVLQSMGMPDQ